MMGYFQLHTLTEELSKEGADWQVHIYGPTYNNTDSPNGGGHSVSWMHTLMFIAEAFKP